MARSANAAPAVARVRRSTVFVIQCPHCDHTLRKAVAAEAWRAVPAALTCPQCQAVVGIPAQPEEGGRMPVWTRDNTLDLFQRQLYALQSEIVGTISKYVLEVRVKGKAYTAVVEGYSHDYWLHRIDKHPLAKRVDLVICYRHNSCLRQKVLELCSKTGREYDAFSRPAWFDIEARGGRAWAQVFTGALLAGDGEAYTELEEKIREESPASYYRYLTKLAELSAHKWGRPAAV